MTEIAALHKLIRQFRDDRSWLQFHSPKNISMSIAIEASELMEHFQWLTDAQSRAFRHNPNRESIGEELADVLIYCFSFADVMDYDIVEIIEDKIKKNDQKYPAKEYLGRY